MSKKRGDLKNRLKMLAAKDEQETPENEQASTPTNDTPPVIPEPENKVIDEVQSPETITAKPETGPEIQPEQDEPETAAELQLPEAIEPDSQIIINENTEELNTEPASAPPENQEKPQKTDSPKSSPGNPKTRDLTELPASPKSDSEQKVPELNDKKMSVTTVRLTSRHKNFINYHIDITIDLARKFGYKSKNFSQDSPHFRSSLEIYSRLITSEDWQLIFESWDGTTPLEIRVTNYLIEKLKKHKVPLNNEL